MFVVVANILIWIAVGFFIVRYGFRVKEALILLPLAMGVGVFAYFVIVFILLRFLPANISGWLTSGLMLLVSGILWYRNHHRVESLQLSVRRSTGVILLLLWLALAGIVAGVRPKERQDEFDHLPRATMIAQAGQPLRFSSGSYINPQMCQQAHYAEGVMVGILFSQSRIFDLSSLFDIRVVYNATTAIGLCFVFLWLLLKRNHVAWVVLGTFLFITIGSPNWLTVAHQIPGIEQHIPQTEFFEASRFTSEFIVDPIKALKNPESPMMFPRTDMVSFMWYLTSPNPASFWVAGFLVLIGWLFLREKPHPWYWWAGLGAMLALSTVYFTTGLILLGPIIGLDLLFDLYKKRRMPDSTLMSLAAFGIAGGIFLLFQGGLITDQLFCPLKLGGHNPEYTASWISFVPFLSYPGFTYHELDTRLYLYNPTDWNFFFMAWGIGLFIAPLMLVHAIHRRQPTLIMIIISAGISILMPFVILIENFGPNMPRIPTLAIWLLGATSVVFLKGLWDKHWINLNKLMVVGIVLLMSVSTVANVIQMLLRPVAPSMFMRPIDYEVQRDWFGRLDIGHDAVFDPHVYRGDEIGIGQAIGVARPITIFGTYGRTSGHIAMMAVPQYRSETWAPWYDSGGFPGYLRDAGYTYLYLAESDFNDMFWRISGVVFNPDYYQLVQTWEDPETREVRQLFKIVSSAYNSMEPVSPEVLIKNAIADHYQEQYLANNAEPVVYVSTDVQTAMAQLLHYLWNIEHGLVPESPQTVESLLNIKAMLSFSETLPNKQATAPIRWQSVSSPEDLLNTGTKSFIIDYETLSSLKPDQQHWLTQHLFRLANWWIFDRQVVEYVVGTPNCFNAAPQMVTFGDLITLQSGGNAISEVGGDRFVCVRLVWQARSLISHSYKVAAHVVSETGEVVAQYDGIPASYLTPTNTWTPEQSIIDQFGIRLPDDIAVGRYEVHIIVYDEASGERLLLSEPSSASDSFSIGGFAIMDVNSR